jgi:hypothetical protein
MQILGPKLRFWALNSTPDKGDQDSNGNNDVDRRNDYDIDVIRVKLETLQTL